MSNPEHCSLSVSLQALSIITCSFASQQRLSRYDLCTQSSEQASTCVPCINDHPWRGAISKLPLFVVTTVRQAGEHYLDNRESGAINKECDIDSEGQQKLKNHHILHKHSVSVNAVDYDRHYESLPNLDPH